METHGAERAEVDAIDQRTVKPESLTGVNHPQNSNPRIPDVESTCSKYVVQNSWRVADWKHGFERLGPQGNALQGEPQVLVH